MQQQKNISAENARYLAGEMNEKECHDFEQGLENDHEMKKEFDTDKKIWEAVENIKESDFPDRKSGWEKLHSRLESDGLLFAHEKSDVFSRKGLWFRIAASLLILLALGTPLYYLLSDSTSSGGLKELTTSHQNSSYNLPDGSYVLLKKGSSLSFTEDFSSKRSVQLKGEAFFDIMSDSLHPFTITTLDARITVLGTSFSVKESVNDKATEVYVEEGRVRISSEKSEHEIILSPGDFGRVSKGQPERDVLPNPNYLSWKTREFVFSSTPLPEVIALLEDAYQVNIGFEAEEIQDLKLSSTYDKLTIDAILKTLERAFPVEVAKKGSDYWISLITVKTQ